jgi:hypothetical protein
MVNRALSIDVQIGLSDQLRSIAADGNRRSLAQSVRVEVEDFAREVGLGGAARVTVKRAEAPRPVRVTVNGTPLPYPPDLLSHLWTELPHEGLGAGGGQNSTIGSEWLATQAEPHECSPEDVAELVVAMIRDRPSALADERQAQAYDAEAGRPGIQPAALRRVLASLLDLGVAPFPREAVVDAVASSTSVEDAFETAFATLKTRQVEIVTSATYRSVIAPANGPGPHLVSSPNLDPAASAAFTNMERRLLVEWGIVPPDITFVTDNAVPNGTIAVKLNDRRSRPIQGLEENERIDLTGSLGAAGIKAKRTMVNPLNLLDYSVADLNDFEPRDRSLPLSTPAEFAALVVYGELVTNAHRLIGIDETLYLLKEFESRAPELVHLVLRHFAIADIAGLLRLLARERIPLRFLPIILERLAQLVGRELQPRMLVEYVRRGLSAHLTHRFVRGPYARSFFALSPAMEDEISKASSALRSERVRDAVWRTLRQANVPPIRAALLTQKAPRELARDVVAPELPELVVLGQSELSGEIPIVAYLSTP